MSAAVSIALFAGIVVIACALVAVAGIFAQRHVAKQAPESRALTKFTPAGVALIAFLTLALVVGAALRKLAPDSLLGKFLNTEMGLSIGVFAVWLAFVVGAMLLQRRGHPIAEKRQRAVDKNEA
jgi:hypothetical protein